MGKSGMFVSIKMDAPQIKGIVSLHKLDVQFPGENSTGLPPVPFHQHFALKLLRLPIFLQKSIVCDANKVILSHEKKC